MNAHNRHRDLIAYLLTVGARYQVLTHPPCRTSEESAAARAAAGWLATVGATALVIKRQAHADYALIVLPGSKRLDNRAARATLGLFRFATPEELSAATLGLVPGSVPPFAWPFLPGVKQVFVDPDIGRAAWLGFNAAALDRSVVMDSREYLRVLGDHEMTYWSSANL